MKGGIGLGAWVTGLTPRGMSLDTGLALLILITIFGMYYYFNWGRK